MQKPLAQKPVMKKPEAPKSVRESDQQKMIRESEVDQDIPKSLGVQP